MIVSMYSRKSVNQYASKGTRVNKENGTTPVSPSPTVYHNSSGQLWNQKPRNPQSQPQHCNHGEDHKRDQIPMGLPLGRLNSLPRNVLDFSARGFRELLELQELFVALFIEGDDGRAAVIRIDNWTLALL